MNMCDKFSRENPSFSSTLLDSICRSIDESSPESKPKPNQDLNFHKETTLKNKQAKYSKNEFCIDPMLMNSSSTSSDSSSGGGFSISSSDSDSFYHTTTSNSRPKPIRTHQVVEKNNFNGGSSRSKSKAFELYNELKKVKQPISPGAKLTSFINSIFNSKTKKTKSEDKATSSRTCFSASSFSRSCLSMRTKGSTRTSTTHKPVRFCLDDDDEDSTSRPCEQIKITKHGHVECRNSKELDYKMLLNNYRKMKNEAKATVVVAVDEYDDDDYDDDVASYASSDLFELDHLRAIGNERYLEELPVYETTHFDSVIFK